MYYKTCEICGLKSGRNSNQKRVFMAQFPLDEKRCKQWVKAIGNEDFLYVPIEKLHELKYVCGTHFKLDDFNRKRTRLKRCAIPSLQLKLRPLPEEMMNDFPLHVASQEREKLQKEKQNDGDDMANDEPPGDELPDDTADDGTIDLTQIEPKKELFSWQEPGPIALDDPPNDVVPDGTQPKGTGVQNETIQETPTSDNQPPVEDYCCDGCKENITGFRYTCVQCADYDLCGACERLMLHAQHYVLRVPPGKSAKEVRLILEAIRMKLDTIDYDLGIIKIKKEEDPFEEVANENENLILATSAPEGVADVSSRRDEVPKNVSIMVTGDGVEIVGIKDDMSFTEDWLDEPLLEMYENADPLRAVSKDTVEPSISKLSGEKHMRNIEKSNKEPIIKVLSPLETHDSDKQSGPKQCSLLKLPPRQIYKRKSEITNSEPKKLLLKIYPLKNSDEKTTQSVENQPTSTSRVTEEADVEKEKGIERRCHTVLRTYTKKPSSDPRLSSESKFIEKKYVKRK